MDYRSGVSFSSNVTRTIAREPAFGGTREWGRMTMRHVKKRRHERTRIVALVATFLLLVAGVLVSAPGMMSASASGSPSTTDQVDDHENEDENQAEDEDQDEPEVECQAENEHENEDEG